MDNLCIMGNMVSRAGDGIDAASALGDAAMCRGLEMKQRGREFVASHVVYMVGSTVVRRIKPPRR